MSDHLNRKLRVNFALAVLGLAVRPRFFAQVGPFNRINFSPEMNVGVYEL